MDIIVWLITSLCALCILADISRKFGQTLAEPGYGGLRHDSHRPVPGRPRENSARPERTTQKSEKSRSEVPDSSRRIATLHTFSIFVLRPFSLSHLSISSSFDSLHSPLRISSSLAPLASSLIFDNYSSRVRRAHRPTQRTHHEGLFIHVQLRILLGRGLDSQLEKVLSME